MGFSLRAQIALTLLASTALTALLVGFPGLNLTERALLEREVRAGWRLLGLVERTVEAVDGGSEEARAERLERALRGLIEDGVAEHAAWIRSDGEVEIGLPEGGELPWRAGSGVTFGRAESVELVTGVDGEGYVRLVVPLSEAEGAVALWLWTGEITGQLETARFLMTLYALLAAAVVLILGFVLLSRLVVAPIRRIRVATERVAAGDHASRLSIDSGSEIGDLARSFNHMLDRLEEGRSALEREVTALEAAKRDLERAQRAVIRGEKLASVGRLAAGVAHEVGNPLAAVLGMVELMRDEPELDADERGELLVRTERELLRIHTTIRDLLDYSRSSDEVVSASSALEVVEQARKLVEAQPRFRTIEVDVASASQLPLVRADSDRLLQVLVNLLLNAADAIEGEGWIRITVDEERGGVALSVTDSGPGVAPEARGHLFEPFFTTKAVGEGTGLGLAICESIVEGQGGEIKVDEGGVERDGHHVGATFTFWLPACEPDDE